MRIRPPSGENRTESFNFNALIHGNRHLTMVRDAMEQRGCQAAALVRDPLGRRWSKVHASWAGSSPAGRSRVPLDRYAAMQPSGPNASVDGGSTVSLAQIPTIALIAGSKGEAFSGSGLDEVS
jgi:hypothetical protein